MNKPMLFAILLALCASPRAANFDTFEQCSRIVAEADRPGAAVPAATIELFLESLSSNLCRRSVEYVETSNEALFNLMRRAPQTFFTVLRKVSPTVQRQVGNELDNPIHDMIHYPAIDQSIGAIANAELRAYARKVFGPAYERHLAEVKAWEARNNAKWTYPKIQP